MVENTIIVGQALWQMATGPLGVSACVVLACVGLARVVKEVK